MDVVLLDGWIKDKKGKTSAEDSRIASAQLLHREFLAELSCASTLEDLLEEEAKYGK